MELGQFYRRFLHRHNTLVRVNTLPKMSVKKDLYLLVKTAIGTIPEVKTFGKFNNQFATEEVEQPFNNPSVFFAFEAIPWQPSSTAYANSNATAQQKSELVEFALHIGYWTNDSEEDKFLGLLDLEEKIYRAITNLQGDNIGPVQRVSEIDAQDHTEPLVWQVNYSTMLTERGAANNTTAVNATPVVTTLNT